MKHNADRQRLDAQRCLAAQYFTENFSREERYLIIFSRDFSDYLGSSDWLRSSDSRNCQKYFDFLIDYENLKSKMQEFRWSKDFLLENGIDFAAIRNLYFAVA